MRKPRGSEGAISRQSSTRRNAWPVKVKDPMPAITLWQPWATLVAMGLKTIETRSWLPPHELLGQRIAIHAAARPVRQCMVGCGAPFVRSVAEALRVDVIDLDDLPRGAVLCTATLADAGTVAGVGDRVEVGACGSRRFTRLEAIDPWGDFRAGRCLWFLEEVSPLTPPRSARGAQGIWTWYPQREGRA